MLALNELVHSCFDDVHSRRPLGMLSKSHDKPAMMKATTLSAVRVGYVHDLAGLNNAVTMLGYGIYALQTRFEPELLERCYACRLEEFTHDAVWLGE